MGAQNSTSTDTARSPLISAEVVPGQDGFTGQALRPVLGNPGQLPSSVAEAGDLHVCATCFGPLNLHRKTGKGFCAFCQLHVISDNSADEVFSQASTTVPDRSESLDSDAEVFEMSAGATAEVLRRSAQPGDTEMIPSIAAILGCHGGDYVRCAQPVEVRLAAVEAVRTLVPKFSTTWQNDDIEPRTWEGLPQVLQVLIACTSDPDHAVRARALQVLCDVGPQGEEALLVACTSVFQDQSASEDLRVQAADTLRCLAIRGDVLSVRAALVAFTNDHDSVRNAGFSILKRICGPRGECESLLLGVAPLATAHTNAEVRALSLELIANMVDVGDADGIDVAVTCIEDSNEDVRKAAVAALKRLWQRGDTSAVPVIASLMKRQRGDAQLRCAAIECLTIVADRGDTSACLVAVAALDDHEPSVQAAAGQALKRLCTRGDAAVLEVLIAYLARPEFELQRLAVEVLAMAASSKDSGAVAALRGLCSSEDVSLQLAAEQTLRQIR